MLMPWLEYIVRYVCVMIGSALCMQNFTHDADITWRCYIMQPNGKYSERDIN